MLQRLPLLVILSIIALSFAASPVRADAVIYDESLAPGWANWSWGGSYDFQAATPGAPSGQYTLAASSQAYGGLSLQRASGMAALTTGAAPVLSFWFSGDPAPIRIELRWGQTTSTPIPLADHVTATASFRRVVIPLSLFGVAPDPMGWQRITFMNGLNATTSYRIDRLDLLSEMPELLGFTAAEVASPRHVMVFGRGDAEAIEVTLDGAPIEVEDTMLLENPSRVALTLGADLGPGVVVVATPDETFMRVLVGSVATVSLSATHTISPNIYGMAFPDLASAQDVGFGLARWGGNHTSPYNPLLDVTNAGRDDYYKNRPSISATTWLDQVEDAGLTGFFSVPSLSWVAKDDASWSFSVAKYGGQKEVSSSEPDAGRGQRYDNSWITNDPTDSMVPWSENDAREWLESLVVPPRVAAVGNEMDIAHETHRDVQPTALGYAAMFDKYVRYAEAILEALPETEVAAPSSCCWWFYWNSGVGSGDKAAHGGVDFLPWFLGQVAAHDGMRGARSLSYLDVHYCSDGVYTETAGDAAMKARRLRSTRSLWDPDYIDEGWIGSDVYATATQPLRNAVMLIPRMKALIEEHYPGTRLMIGEWSFGAERDLSGGLATVDALGIFGREGLDAAAFWSTPPTGAAVLNAFRLYRDSALPFGARSLPVTHGEPDLLGVFAASGEVGEPDEHLVTVVLVNKDPARDRLVELVGIEGARVVHVRRYGGHLGPNLAGSQELVGSEAMTIGVAAYGAVLVAFERCAVHEGEGDCDGNGLADRCDADCDGDGAPDSCELASGAVDCDASGVPDSCELSAATDCDANGILDACDVDCDGNGVPDSCDLTGGGADCDGDGVLDVCQLAGGAEDCDDDGVLDMCAADCDVDGLPDACAITFGVDADCDADGVPDACAIADGAADCDADGVLDECVLAAENDCDGNAVLDGCQADCDRSMVADACEIDAATDCDGNDVLDTCEIDAHDCNGDGWLDVCVLPIEVCNGVDDDCDGATDGHDTSIVMPSCEVGCERLPGDCVGGVWLDCTCPDPGPEPGPETSPEVATEPEAEAEAELEAELVPEPGAEPAPEQDPAPDLEPRARSGEWPCG